MRLRFIFRPSGPTCRHVHVTEAGGRMVAVLTEAELAGEITPTDNPLMVQIKRATVDAATVDPTLLRTNLELRDFTL